MATGAGSIDDDDVALDAARRGWWWRLGLYAIANFVTGSIVGVIAGPLLAAQSWSDVARGFEFGLGQLAAVLGSHTDSFEWSFLVWSMGASAAVTALQLAFLLPVFRPPAASSRGGSLRVRAWVGAIVGCATTVALVIVVMEWLSGSEAAIDRFGSVANYGIPLAAMAPAWAAWAWFLLRRQHLWDPLGIDRILGRLLWGSTLSVALVVPFDAMTRRQKDCYCFTGGYVAVCLSLAALWFFLGPFIVLGLSRPVRRRARRRACLACGYPRRAHAGAVCSECGRGWTRRQRRDADKRGAGHARQAAHEAHASQERDAGRTHDG